MLLRSQSLFHTNDFCFQQGALLGQPRALPGTQCLPLLVGPAHRGILRLHARLASFIEMLRSEEDRARDLSAQLSYDYGPEMLADCWRELDKQVDAWVQKVVQALK